jgi:alkylation response protein AidB-like acyl-CoA dehydrogenase
LADVILVEARVADGSGLFIVDVGLEADVQPLRALDPSRPVAQVTMSRSPARAVGDVASANDVAERVRDLLRLALAADAVGGSRHLLHSAVEYAKTRVQFGRPIGEFQSIKHRCADLFVAVEAAAAAVEAAFAELVSQGFPNPVATSVASIYAQEAYWLATRTAMQIHGGLALTWEHETHLYLKRATSSAHLLGNPDLELGRLADAVLADGYDVVAELIG